MKGRIDSMNWFMIMKSNQGRDYGSQDKYFVFIYNILLSYEMRREYAEWIDG